jgi:transaldolase
MEDLFSTMQIFLDTADTELIRKYYQTGLIDGVTTNPTLIMKSGQDPEEVYSEIARIGIRDISMEVVGDASHMIEEGERLTEKYRDNATIKVPFVGRVDDNSFGGLCLVKDIANVYAKQNWGKTQVLAASLRGVRDVGRAFEYGANIVTMPPGVFEKMYKHILTDKGMELFDNDWKVATADK